MAAPMTLKEARDLIANQPVLKRDGPAWLEFKKVVLTLEDRQKQALETLDKFNELRPDLRMVKSAEFVQAERTIATALFDGVRKIVSEENAKATAILEKAMRGKDPFDSERADLSKLFGSELTLAQMLQRNDRRNANIERLLVRQEVDRAIDALATMPEKIPGEAPVRYFRELLEAEDRRHVFEFETAGLARIRREFPPARAVLVADEVEQARQRRLAPDMRQLQADRNEVIGIDNLVAAIEGAVGRDEYFGRAGGRVFATMKMALPGLFEGGK